MFRKKKPENYPVEIPSCYSFEYTAEMEKVEDIWGLICDQLRIKYELFYEGDLVDEGSVSYMPEEPRIEQRLFVFAFQRAQQHAKNANLERRFNIGKGVNVLPNTMVIDADLAKQILPASK